MTTQVITVENEGQIKVMDLPSGFVEEPVPQNEWLNGPHIRNFYLEENPDVRIAFYFRGHQIREKENQTFVELLNNENHVLNEDEVSSLQQIIYENCQPENFKVSIATIENINGKHVLYVEGNWVESDNYDIGVFISANPETCLVQEIHFLAPLDQQANYRHLFDQSLDSIQWK